MSNPPYEVVILGLGNLLRRDEGLGVRALQRLREHVVLPLSVATIDGGTFGLELLSMIEDTSRLLVLDALLTGGPPGSLARLAGAQIPAYFGMKTSPHEISIPDLLAIARLRGTMPTEVVVLGLQPGSIELGWELSDAVADQLDALVAATLDELRGWGISFTSRLPVVPHQPEGVHHA